MPIGFRALPSKVLISILVCLGPALGVGCGSGNDAAENQPPQNSRGESRHPQEGGTLTLALATPTSLDPAVTDDVYEATVVNQIFSGLVQLDANLNVIPELATTWTISKDKRVYKFNLRRNATFHNGRKVTAEDFVYSFTRLLNEKEIPPGIIQDYLGKIQGVEDYKTGRSDHITGLEAVDTFTLEIRLEHPYASFLSVLSMDQAKVLPQEVVETLGREGFGKEPIGSGPFRMDEWVPGSHLRLLSDKSYFGRKALLDTLLFLHDPEDNTEWRKTAFLERKLDAMQIRENQLAEIREHGTYEVMRRPELSLEFLAFNVQHPVFQDVRVRRAVSMALDRGALKEISGAGFEQAAGLIPVGIPGYSPESKILPYDPERSRELLAEAGYGKERPLVIPLMTVSRSAYGMACDSVLVACLNDVGIKVDLQHVTWSEFDQAIGMRTAGAFQLSWIADIPDPDSFLYSLFVSKGSSNLFGYSNPEVDNLLDAGGRALDQVARLEKYRIAERLIIEDAPLVPLFNVTTLFVLQDNVHGVELSPFGICSVPMERIWLTGRSKDLHAGF